MTKLELALSGLLLAALLVAVVLVLTTPTTVPDLHFDRWQQLADCVQQQLGRCQLTPTVSR